MCAVAMSIPDDVLFDKCVTIGDATDLARQMMAVGLCARRNVSLGYCSDIGRPSLLRDVYGERRYTSGRTVV